VDSFFFSFLFFLDVERAKVWTVGESVSGRSNSLSNEVSMSVEGISE